MRPLPRYATVSAADPSSGLSRLVQVRVELQIAGGGEPVGLHSAGPDLAGLAAFTLDSRGRVASWPLAAIELFGLTAGAAAGRDVRDVLLADPGQRELVDRALAEVAAGRAGTATLALAVTGGRGQVAGPRQPPGDPGPGAPEAPPPPPPRPA